MSKKTPVLVHHFYDDTPVKQSKQKAFLDARRRDAENEALFTPAEKAVGADMLLKAVGAYMRSRCYLNYREHSMVVKVEHPKASDKLSSSVEAFDKAMAELGADVKHKNGHLLYHIFPR